jgi:hypothetical protein
VNLEHSRGSHDGRFFLAGGEASRASAIGVNAPEALAIAVKDCDLPVAMFAALIGSEACGSFLFGFGFRGRCSFGRFLH